MNALLSLIPKFLSKYLGASYRTSLGAIGLWVGALVVLIDVLNGTAPADEVHIGMITTGFTAGWAAWHAKDKQVSNAPKPLADGRAV